MKENLRHHLSSTCSVQELRQWFDPLRISTNGEDKTLLVDFPHSYFADWFAQNVQTRFERELSRYLGPGFIIKYGNGFLPQNGRAEEKRSVTKTDQPFGRGFTFATFLTNKSNYFPVASAKEVTRQKEILYNPLIICGGNGFGKTHLLRAIANEISRFHDPATIFLGGIEDVNDIYSRRFIEDKLGARRHFEQFSFLLLDDIQHLRQYDYLQEELVFIFNGFHNKHKQMVFTCGGRIDTYDFFIPKLQSRLKWGLVINLKESDLAIRIKHIQNFCDTKRLKLNKEQILTLAQRFTDFRSLQGIILKLSAFRKLVKKDIREKDFRHIIDNTEEPRRQPLEPNMVLDVVAEEYGLTPKDLTGKTRHHQIVLARQAAMYLCRDLIGCSYPALGRIFGGKDHSTAMYAVKKVMKMQRDDKEMNQMLTRLRKRCLTRTEG